MKQTAVKPLSGKTIENLAEKFRETFGLEDVLEFPVVRLVEWVLPQVGITINVVDDWELEDAYAVTDTAKGIITLRNTVYEGAVRGNPRDRFTICHEIGHAVLHTPDRVEFARGDVPAYRESEWQANRFASALMAPRSLAMGMTVDQIEECFKMSHEAAEIRYRNLHR